jgi:hypothetical protein
MMNKPSIAFIPRSTKNDPIKTPAFAGVFFGGKKPKIAKVMHSKTLIVQKSRMPQIQGVQG